MSNELDVVVSLPDSAVKFPTDGETVNISDELLEELVFLLSAD